MSTTFAALLAHRVETLPQFDFTPFHLVALSMLEVGSQYHDQAATILAQDKAMSHQILALAARQAERGIETLSQAIRLLGIAFVSRHVEETLAEREPSHRLDPVIADLLTGEHWEHAQSVAVCSQLLAQETGYEKVAHAYTAGLFHDLGEIVARAFAPAEVLEALALPRAVDEGSFTLSDRIIGLNHAVVGAAILERWGLPPAVAEPVRLHHLPSQAKLNKRLARIIHLADAMMECHHRGLPLGISLFPLQKGILAEFPLDRATLLRIAEQADVLVRNGAGSASSREADARRACHQQRRRVSA